MSEIWQWDPDGSFLSDDTLVNKAVGIAHTYDSLADEERVHIQPDLRDLLERLSAMVAYRESTT